MWGALTILMGQASQPLHEINLHGRPARKVLSQPSDLSRRPASYSAITGLQTLPDRLAAAA